MTQTNTMRPELVFQMKFVRQPEKLENIIDWLEGIIREESKKVERLRARGAKKYFLLTNVRGTSHLDKGSIDRVNAVLSTLPIEAVCWWRDDLNRRLDGAWSVKWLYPELMTGPDLIRAIIENGLAEDRERRLATIKAFVMDQYSRESEVKFKQVELQNNLLDLFIDVPVAYSNQRAVKNPNKMGLALRRLASSLKNKSGDEDGAPEAVTYDAENAEIAVGAAALLLNETGQKHFSRCVLEGAPGQGKSTITQYVCQVHRMRLLGIEPAKPLPKQHMQSGVRLPFRIDLRDFAAWLEKIDPFSLTDESVVPEGWAKSLESFLAAQVRYHSGGSAFDVDDIVSVARLSAILLVFDGLDEVARIKHRETVVEEIVAGVKRMQANSGSLQVVVTSRPAAFANSPGLPRDEFAYFSLLSLPRDLITAYSEKWISARRISPMEAKAVRQILKEKLGMPHLRDLARNPMQLAILLGLIHQRGASLPDKRTALYDSYIELFFNREAEKSEVVRNNRSLLIDLHRYLAWVLHGRSEIGRGAGSVRTAELQTLVAGYLKRNGHDEALASLLFSGMVERVVAIVSRVEGSYEFEVQPLREYFVARFLYETAPYSPPGNEKRGTKPDRFDALAKNFYWLNVARFYAGCYSVGELPSLIEGLRTILESDDYQYLSHPRNLAAMLLADWVFTQHPRSVKQVLSLILDGSGLHFYIAESDRRRHGTTALVLPKDAGRGELLARALALLKTMPPANVAQHTLQIIEENDGATDIKADWQTELLKHSSQKRSTWLSYGHQLGYVGRGTDDELSLWLGNEPLDASRIQTLIRAGKIEWLEADPTRFHAAVLAMLSSGDMFGYKVNTSGLLGAFATCAMVEPLYFSSQRAAGTRMVDALVDGGPWETPDLANLNTSLPRISPYKEVYELLEVYREQFERPVDDWNATVDPWDRIVEAIRARYGSSPLCRRFALVASAIKSTAEQCKDASALFDDEASLCRRARYARLRAGQPAWWEAQLATAKDIVDLGFGIQLILTWCSSKTVLSLLDKINLAVLEQKRRESGREGMYEFDRFLGPLGFINRGSRFSLALDELDVRTLVFLTPRLSAETIREFYETRVRSYRGGDPFVLNFGLEYALEQSSLAAEDLDFIEYCHLCDGKAPWRQHWVYIPRRGLPRESAVRILSNASKFPPNLVASAEDLLRYLVGKSVEPVLNVARAQKWFDDPNSIR